MPSNLYVAAGGVRRMQLTYLFLIYIFHHEVFALYRTFSLANSNKNKVCFVCDINKPLQKYA